MSHRISYLKTVTCLPILVAALTVLVLPQYHTAYSNDGETSESIGSYTAGCIKNSVALPRDGKGYQVVRTGRGRYYANPETIDFIIDLAAKVNDNLDGILLIGDIAQQTGGPMPDDHSRHQIGLEADIFFWQHPIAKQRPLTMLEREHTNPNSLLTADMTAIDPYKWEEVHGEILRLASEDGRVDRIFVNPVIKRKLCGVYGDAGWLGKIRPWYGHDGHFHVRLKYPKGNYMCESQEPIEVNGSGCAADLQAWFTDDGRVRKKRTSGSSVQKKLPDACKPIMQSAGGN